MKPQSTFEHPQKKNVSLQELSQILESIGQVWVSDVMQKNPIAINQNENLDTATGLLSDNNFRHLPVINNNGEIQGIVSDRDLLNAILRIPPGQLLDRIENPWNSVKVSSVMSKTPETVSPDTNLMEAGAILLENKISCLPVVEGDHLVGIITSSDFVRLVSQGLGV